MDHYYSDAFRRSVEESLESIRQILDVNRNPQLAGLVPHSYDDKYFLAEFTTNVYLASVVSSLLATGLTPANLAKLIRSNNESLQSITLAFDAAETCTFDKEVVKQEEGNTKVKVGVFSKGTVTTKKTYFWTYTFTHKLYTYVGVDMNTAIVLSEGTTSASLVTLTNDPPLPAKNVHPTVSTPLGWILGHLPSSTVEGVPMVGQFSIDRGSAKCFTPRRNKDVIALLDGSEDLFRFAKAVRSACDTVAARAAERSGLRCSGNHPPSHGTADHEKYTCDVCSTSIPVGDGMYSCRACDWDACLACTRNTLVSTDEIYKRSIFNPVAPLLEPAAEGGEDTTGRIIVQDYAAFLQEQQRTLSGMKGKLVELLGEKGLISASVGSLMRVMQHIRDLAVRHFHCLEFIEDLLRQQLVAAIGKEVTSADFREYMRFHNRKLFSAQYQPRPFAYAIRRPDHDAIGVLSVEEPGDAPGGYVPVSTHVSSSNGAACPPVRVPLNASVSISLDGERYLHSWIDYRFNPESPPALRLNGRARQFSSFILLGGRMVSACTFEPKVGLIVRNGDVVDIPLGLDMIPTAKEFRDAISSLSPEQQEFAKAFRSMQLESTVTAFAVVQIVPQLEILLKLPPESLVKEVALTQQLMDLFVDFQIPSDLLAYDGDEGASTTQKIEVVRNSVAAIYEVIKGERTKAIEKAKEERLFRRERKRAEADLPEPQLFGGGMPRMAMAQPMMAMAYSAAPPPPPSGGMAPPPPACPAPSAPAPAPAPAPPLAKKLQQQQSQTQTQHQQSPPVGTRPAEVVATPAFDVTRVPQALDNAFDLFLKGDAVRPTIIEFRDFGSRKRANSVLEPAADSHLSSEDLRTEKNKAFDLLDALTRSGIVNVPCASVHVFIASTHCFDKTLLECIVQDNKNPIEMVERSSIIAATIVHGNAIEALLQAPALRRVQNVSSGLFIKNS